jgi:hypothetical protein
MKLRERAGELLRWPGWRRTAPVAGSAIAHVVLGAAILSVLAATSTPSPRAPSQIAPQLEVTLVAESLPPKGIRPTPPDAPKAPVQSDAIPSTDTAPPTARAPRKNEKQQSGARPPIAGGKPSEDEGGVYLGDSDLADSGVPLGLRGLLEADPCEPKKGLPRGDCGATWTQKFASNTYTITPSEQQLKRMYPGIIPPCPYKSGCERSAMNVNGTRSVGRAPPGSSRDTGSGSPMAGGAAGLGGPHDSIGRLGFNPDHTDPGFGD